MAKNQQVVTFGPYGGKGGDEFDDGFNDKVRKIIIYCGDVIDSIQVEYENKGNPILAEKHGGEDGGAHMIKLDHSEHLVSISGYYKYFSCKGGHVVVQSLTLKSNKRKFGPYGTEDGTHFASPPNSGVIIGFHGRSGVLLDSIGAYFDPDQ